MPPPEHRAAGQQMRRECRAAARLRPLLPDPRRVRRLIGAVFVGGGGSSRIGLLLRDVHADADDFLEQRPVGKLLLDEPPLAVGQVADRRRPG